ncbi:MAG: hypothetical protein ACTSQ6_11740 [Candidatus Heimdallarchaeaceae archaeon]
MRLVRNNLRSIIESEIYHQRKILREKREKLEELRRTASPSEKEKIDEKIMEVIRERETWSTFRAFMDGSVSCALVFIFEHEHFHDA